MNSVESRSSQASTSSDQRAVAPETQFCVGLKNEPGKLAGLCRTLRVANIAIEALFVSDDEDCCWVNLVANPADATVQTLREGGYDFYTEQVLVVQVGKGPAELEQVAAKLAGAGININYVYGSRAANTMSALVLHVSDLNRAVDVVGGTAA